MTVKIVNLNREKRYQRCFLGIPLPGIFQDKFRTLLSTLEETYLRKVDIETAHIVLEYWGEKTGEEIIKMTEEKKDLLDGYFGNELRIHGFDHFEHTIQVVYLAATGLDRELHLTVGRMPNYKNLTARSNKYLSEIDWKFPITEIGIFGAPDNKQELLVSFKT